MICMIKEILLLGNPSLYEVSQEVKETELAELEAVVNDLHDTMMEFRRVHKAGRAIAAPQIGVKKRILYMNVSPDALRSGGVAFLNPELVFPDEEKMEVMDDCMSFPGLYVKVLRYRRAVIRYRDMSWKPCEMELEGDLSELLQHEYDHLDGILAVMRAIDDKSLFMRKPER